MRKLIPSVVCLFAIVSLFGGGEVGAQKKKKKDEDIPLPKREDVPKLIKTLQKGALVADRSFAADQLGRLGQIQANAVKDAVEPLMNALKDDSEAKVRRASAEALGKISPDPEKVVPLLIDALKDKSLDVNLAAVTALGRYGPEARSAVQPLREFSKAKMDKKITQVVNGALKEIVGKKKG